MGGVGVGLPPHIDSTSYTDYTNTIAQLVARDRPIHVGAWVGRWVGGDVMGVGI